MNYHYYFTVVIRTIEEPRLAERDELIQRFYCLGRLSNRDKEVVEEGNLMRHVDSRGIILLLLKKKKRKKTNISLGSFHVFDGDG